MNIECLISLERKNQHKQGKKKATTNNNNKTPQTKPQITHRVVISATNLLSVFFWRVFSRNSPPPHMLFYISLKYMSLKMLEEDESLANLKSL